MEKLSYEASGKLLLFGEYLVLRGARCLAMPLAVGQKMYVQPRTDKQILWQCYEEGRCWLTVRLSKDLSVTDTTDETQASVIRELLLQIKRQSPDLLLHGLSFRFDLAFHRGYGWGTSATLISLLSQWSNVDAYSLLEASFGGSGYDVAVAAAKTPVVYSVANGIERSCVLPEAITAHLLFVYLGQKQKSSAAVEAFRNRPTTSRQLAAMNQLVDEAAVCRHLPDWEQLMRESEALLSPVLDQPEVQQQYFSDYPYVVKSLGAWGGDFVMATCREIAKGKAYFRHKGKHPVFTYNELIKK